MQPDDKQASRLDILTAAANLFSEQGYNGTSFAAVAKAAQHSKALVQYHFPSKEQLWKNAVRHVWQQRDSALPRYLDDQFLAQLDEQAQNQMIRQLCRGLIRFTADNPQWVKIMYLEASNPGPRLEWMVEEFFQQDFAAGSAMVELAQQRKLLPTADPMSTLFIMGGMMIHYVNVAPITQRITGIDPLTDEQIEHYVDNFLRILQRP